MIGPGTCPANSPVCAVATGVEPNKDAMSIAGCAIWGRVSFWFALKSRSTLQTAVSTACAKTEHRRHKWYVSFRRIQPWSTEEAGASKILPSETSAIALASLATKNIVHAYRIYGDHRQDDHPSIEDEAKRRLRRRSIGDGDRIGHHIGPEHHTERHV
jgi:hypothetical protein